MSQCHLEIKLHLCAVTVKLTSVLLPWQQLPWKSSSIHTIRTIQGGTEGLECLWNNKIRAKTHTPICKTIYYLKQWKTRIRRMWVHSLKELRQADRSCRIFYSRPCSASRFQIPSVAWFSHNQVWYLFNMWSSGVTFKTTRKCQIYHSCCWTKKKKKKFSLPLSILPNRRSCRSHCHTSQCHGARSGNATV